MHDDNAVHSGLLSKQPATVAQQLCVRHASQGPCCAAPPSTGLSNVYGSTLMLHTPGCGDGVVVGVGVGLGLEPDPLPGLVVGDGLGAGCEVEVLASSPVESPCVSDAGIDGTEHAAA